MKKLLIIISLCIFSNQAFAFKFTAEICQEYGLGKNWYCEDVHDDTQNEISSDDIMNSSLPAEDKATQLNQLWEVQRKKAVITGKEQDIKKFLSTHNLIINKGIDFARISQELIENSPLLSNSESYYKNMHEQNIREKEQKEILDNAYQRYGLVFIYSSNCPYCHRQLPIILKFKDRHQLQVMGISIDGNYFENLDENITDETITNDPLVQAFPTILLLDKYHPAKIFISKGLTSLDTLEDKIVRRIKERENEE